MCLAVPGRVVDVLDADPHYAMVDVGGVRRKIHIGLLKREGTHPGDWVLIHAGFAMSKISEEQATEQLRWLSLCGNMKNDDFGAGED